MREGKGREGEGRGGEGRGGKLDRIAKKESFSVCFFCILELFDEV